MEMKLLVYADDLALYSHSHADLQKALISLSRYVKETELEINVKKTKSMKFGGGR